MKTNITVLCRDVSFDCSLLCRFDDVLQRLLTDMELEDNLSNRRIYSRHAVQYFRTMGIACVRHFPRIFRVVCNYMEISDAPSEEARFNALDMLETAITIAWPRLEGHCEKLFKALIKLLFDASMDKSDSRDPAKERLIQKTRTNLVLLKLAVPERVVPWLEAVKEVESTDLCRSVFCDVLESTE